MLFPGLWLAVFLGLLTLKAHAERTVAGLPGKGLLIGHSPEGGRPSSPGICRGSWSVAQGVPLQTDHMGETLSARGTSPTGCIIDGPLAFDNANDGEAAAEKSIASDVAGDADILLAPEIESGNILAKQLALVSHADAAGIVMGARVPSS